MNAGLPARDKSILELPRGIYFYYYFLSSISNKYYKYVYDLLELIEYYKG